MIRVVRNLTLALGAVLVIGYAGILGYLYVEQRHLLYLNTPGAEAPDIHGLARISHRCEVHRG